MMAVRVVWFVTLLAVIGTSVLLGSDYGPFVRVLAMIGSVVSVSAHTVCTGVLIWLASEV